MAENAPSPHQRRESRSRRDAETTSWIVGALLILLGVAFLLENAGVVELTGNWWAVFIYLAAFASFANAWRSKRATGQFGKAATSSLVWGLVLMVVATIFLLNLSWDQWWPAILVAIGVGIVSGHLLGGRAGKPDDVSDI